MEHKTQKLEAAVQLIGSILNAQKLTLQEHQQVQEAWALLLTCLRNAADKEKSDGVNELHVSGAV